MGRRREHQGQLILLRLLLGSPTPPPSLATRTARYFFPAYSIPPSQLVISTASDVLHDLNRASDVDPSAINSTERPRLVHSHGTATPSDGGLGIRPDNDRVHDGPSTTLNLAIVGFTLSRDDRYSLHDITRSQVRASIPTTWFPLRSAVRRRRRSISISWLLNSYPHLYLRRWSLFDHLFLHFILWSVVLVEYWHIRERLYAVARCSLGSVRVEKHRLKYIEGHRWWKRKLKILFSVPVIVFFASVLVLLATIFVLGAFVTSLYSGPGRIVWQLVPSRHA